MVVLQDGATPAFLACHNNSSECLSLLVKAGVDLNKAKEVSDGVFVSAGFVVCVVSV